MIENIEKLKQDFKKAGFDVDAPAFAFHFDDFKKSPLSTFIPLFTRLLHDVRQGGTIAVDDIEKVEKGFQKVLRYFLPLSFFENDENKPLITYAKKVRGFKKTKRKGKTL